MNNLTKGSIILLDIRKMGINGEGIGYYNKLAVFCKGAIQKERVYCKITEVYDKYAVGEIDSIIEESNRRVEPICKFYKDCGACNMQHIKLNEQLKIKREVLINSLKRYTKLDVSKLLIYPTVKSDRVDYRNKSQMPFRDTNFGLALGLYQEGSNKFIYVDNCAITDKNVNYINEEVLSILRKYDEKTTKNGGVLKYLCVRCLNEAQVTFILSEFKEVYKKIAKEVIDSISLVKTVAYSIQSKNDNSIFGSEAIVLEGKNYIKDEMLGLKISLSPKSFYQLNKSQSEKVYKEILDSDIKDTDIVFDAYSGIGVLGLLIAKKAKHVYSCDFNSDSIKNARIIARENDISNITFYSDRIETRFPKLIDENIKPDLIVLDPPRSGLDDKVINSLLEMKAKEVFYISCNASSLAKNLNKLLSIYDIEYLRPYDFFTETALVETVCKLKLLEEK